jgi:hypothetical protein
MFLSQEVLRGGFPPGLPVYKVIQDLVGGDGLRVDPG